MKYLDSKWTSLKPKNKEKHFIVLKEKSDLDCLKKDKVFIVQAVYSKKEYPISIKDLNDNKLWVRGWR